MIFVIGDLLLDEYRYVDVKRVSPEAPCLIGKHIVREDRRLGGAGNVAANVFALTNDLFVLGACDDAYMKLLGKHGIKGICLSSEKTSVKMRFVDSKTRIQVFRYDIETETPPAEQLDEYKQFFDDFEEYQWQYQAVCVVADYSKGMIKGYKTRRVPGCRINIVSTKNTQPYDVLPSKFKTKRDPKSTNILVVNAGEYQGAKAIWGYDYIVRTEGENGITLIKVSEDLGMIEHEEEVVAHIPGIKVDVFDVTGAGDTVTAMIAYYLNERLGDIGQEKFFDAIMTKACEIANYAASLVIGKSGTTAISSDEMQAYLQSPTTSDQNDSTRP